MTFGFAFGLFLFALGLLAMFLGYVIQRLCDDAVEGFLYLIAEVMKILKKINQS